jgi:hypothetical protein
MPKTIDDFKNKPDYKDAISSDEIVYFGSFSHEESILKQLLSDIDEKGSNSQWFFNVFYPGKRLDYKKTLNTLNRIKNVFKQLDQENSEIIQTTINKLCNEIYDNTIPAETTLTNNWLQVHDDQIKIIEKAVSKSDANNEAKNKIRFKIPIDFSEEWTYEKNQAFWAGAIEKKRRFLLTTDIIHYGRKLTGTVDEILWLQDNGYMFEPYKKDITQTLISPPANLNNLIIRDYGNGYGKEGNAKDMMTRLGDIKKSILQQRESFAAKSEEKTGDEEDRTLQNGKSIKTNMLQ